MKFIKLDLLTLLISLFLFASCENTSTIGLEVDPTIAIKGTLVDTATITSRTITDDIGQTNGLVRHPLGYITDPIIGTTEASLAMTVNISTAAYSFGGTPSLDSAILVLNYGGEFYGDSTANYNINVYQIDETIGNETSFLSNRVWHDSNVSIGNKTGKIYPTTKYKVTDIVVGKPDTLRTVTPQIRIPLNKTFIQDNIINLSTTSLKTNANFTNVFRGLRVRATSSGAGGIMFFEFTGAEAGVYLYYKSQNTTTLKTDSISVNFPILSSVKPVAATVTHTYSTAVNTQLNNPNTQYPITYLQPLSGLKNKIAFPYLNKFATNVGRVAVNKAELVIDLSAGTDVIPFGPAQRLALYRYDIAEKRQNLPDNNTATQYTSGDPRAQGAFGGYYNLLTKQYIFNVTAYVQDLLDGRTLDYGTFLAPTPTAEFSVYPSISSASRSVIGAFKKSPLAGDNIMKLNIYYNKIN